MLAQSFDSMPNKGVVRGIRNAGHCCPEPCCDPPLASSREARGRGPERGRRGSISARGREEGNANAIGLEGRGVRPLPQSHGHWGLRLLSG